MLFMVHVNARYGAQIELVNLLHLSESTPLAPHFIAVRVLIDS